MQQKPQKKVPVRRCVGCNAQKPKKELVRIVRSPEGEVGVDLTGKRSGRGAYLCPSASCLAKARKAKRLEQLRVSSTKIRFSGCSSRTISRAAMAAL